MHLVESCYPHLLRGEHSMRFGVSQCIGSNTGFLPPRSPLYQACYDRHSEVSASSSDKYRTGYLPYTIKGSAVEANELSKLILEIYSRDMVGMSWHASSACRQHGHLWVIEEPMLT